MTKRRDADVGLPPVDWSRFDGMNAPTYTQAPDDLFDWVMAYLTGAELKVLLYIVRRTFGFKKDCDAISIDQLCNGIVTRDGRRLDLGTGLKRPTVLEALRSLRQKNLITGQQQIDPETGSRPTVYALNLRQEADGRMIIRSIPGGTNGHTRGDGGGSPPVGPGLPRGLAEETRGVGGARRPEYARPDAQETVVQETVNQEDSFSNSSKPPRTIKERAGKTTDDRIERRPIYSPYVAELANDLSGKFHDETHAASNRTRALRLWAASRLDDQAFGRLMQEARLVAQRRGNIERDATDGSPPGTKNRMPYFFAVLEDLVELAQELSEPISE